MDLVQSGTCHCGALLYTYWIIWHGSGPYVADLFTDAAEAQARCAPYAPDTIQAASWAAAWDYIAEAERETYQLDHDVLNHDGTLRHAGHQAGARALRDVQRALEEG
jgi:hypothetical protein